MKKSVKKVVRVGSLGNLPLSDELDALHGMKHTTGDVSFAGSDIDRFLEGKQRRNLDDKSIFWIKRIMGIIRDTTGRTITKETMDRLHDIFISTYPGNSAPNQGSRLYGGIPGSRSTIFIPHWLIHAQL